mgnify:CR=1 FL=1
MTSSRRAFATSSWQGRSPSPRRRPTLASTNALQRQRGDHDPCPARLSSPRAPWRVAVAGAAALAIPRHALQRAPRKPVALKLSSWVPAQHPLNPALQAWADDIKKASDGTHHRHAVPVRATRQGVRPLRHGARRHRRRHLRQSRLPAGTLPDDRRGVAAVHVRQRQGRHARRSTPGTAHYAAKEMKDVQFCFAFVHDPGTFHCAQEASCCPATSKGMKVRPATSTIGQMVTCARRHQRAGLGARGARHARARRRRRDHLPVGLDPACSASTRSVKLPHGRAALRDAVRLGDEQGQVRRDVARRRRR